jgi:uncharacterized protein YgfB (UPF0149 family)
MEASEMHATLCGLICIDNQVDRDKWLSTSGLILDNSNLLHVEAVTIFDHLYQVSREQINDSTCDFHLLLPEEGAGLGGQVTALGDWCQGYLLGLSAGGVEDFKQQPDDVAEFLRDVTQIAGAGVSYDVDGSEDDEKAYEELVEYVRVGVLLVNEELNPVKSAAMPESTLH